MNVKCALGFHSWTGCQCLKCKRTRDEEHNWSKDCEKCSRCGTVRTNAHQWSGCKCSACSRTRDQDHDWTKDCETCSRCGAARANAHQWSGCKCLKCPCQRHRWIDDKCQQCGAVREHIKSISEGGNMFDPRNPRDVELMMKVLFGR
jgi:hypothetical protein